jgi:hypothetical protein
MSFSPSATGQRGRGHWPSRLILTLGLTVLPASALDVFKFDPAINLRFAHGTYADVRLDENPTFLLAGHDLSGLGWEPGNFGVTLISPRHFLTAAHVAPQPGATVSFCNRDGITKHYVVESLYVVQHGPGISTDLVLGRLAAAIPAADRVGYFPTLLLPASADYLGLKVFTFGNYQSCGTNTIARWGSFDVLPFARGDHVPDDIMLVMEWHQLPGQAQAQGNDSGSPTFVLREGQLAIVGTHSAVNVSQMPYLTFDVLIPAYYSQIRARLALDGYAFGNAATAAPASAR